MANSVQKVFKELVRAGERMLTYTSREISVKYDCIVIGTYQFHLD